MIDKLITVFQLGPVSLMRVLFYKLTVSLGINPVKKLFHSHEGGDFFIKPVHSSSSPLEKDARWESSIVFFNWKEFELTSPFPKWHFDYFNKADIERPERSWWEIKDFDSNISDIKIFWELSRFDWVIVFAKKAIESSNSSHIDNLNLWLNDWIKTNPFYKGPNWKCGQEASIRVMHLAMAALIIEQHDKVTTTMASFVRGHLKRIWPTLSYSIGQNNNHGTSEAAALYIGGSWLSLLSDDKEAKKWANAGKYWLENRVRHLVMDDGTFSQYSTNYHRLVLDTLSMVELWRSHIGLPEFSKHFYMKAVKAVHWLYQMIAIENGDAPNLGANDGARLFPYSDTDYRDYRPTVHLAGALFMKRDLFSTKAKLYEHLGLFSKLNSEPSRLPQSSAHFPEGGLCLLRNESATVLFRYPKFKYRPGQADPLHLDLWVSSLNVFRDAGSFSYNANADEHIYFNGVEGHNTVQFDDHQPMPKLGRFLWGRWLSVNRSVKVDLDGVCKWAEAGYTDRHGCSHNRKVELVSEYLLVTDWVSGFKNKAKLRWRLLPGDWKINGNVITFSSFKIMIASNAEMSIRLISGWESRYYYQKTPIPVVEVEVQTSASITTQLFFS